MRYYRNLDLDKETKNLKETYFDFWKKTVIVFITIGALLGLFNYFMNTYGKTPNYLDIMISVNILIFLLFSCYLVYLYKNEKKDLKKKYNNLQQRGD